jgi:gluconolactonase
MGSIERIDPRINDIVPQGATIEVLAQGFEWSEGPAWHRINNYLLFSDIPKNTIYKWSEQEGLSIYMRPSGYTGSDPAGFELGTNGLVFDKHQNLFLCDHGNRCISRLNAEKFIKTVLVDTYHGHRLNSPNDAVFKSNGDLYFTDPPYGLKGLNESPQKELNFNGIYRFTKDGELFLLTKEMSFPNGIAFSPDEKTLYVANSDGQKPLWMAFDVLENGDINNGRIFYDAKDWKVQGRKGSPDGMAVDIEGNIFATGPGGVHIFTPQGGHLGTLNTGQATANCTFGQDGSVLFITADSYLCRIKLNTKGIGY